MNMKTYCRNILFILLIALSWSGCTENPVDEDGLSITGREECYVSNFDLLGTDRLSVRIGNAEIDDEDCTIKVVVAYGTDLRNLYPQFSLVTDAKLEPKITGITDFSDLDNPKKYTVVSGNRKVRKTYTVFVSVQPLK